MRIVVDIDGVICEETKPYSQAKIKEGAAEQISRWMNQGHRIILYTARRESDRALTVRWLAENGIKWHSLIMGKPKGDVYIDDRAKEFRSWRSLRTLV